MIVEGNKMPTSLTEVPTLWQTELSLPLLNRGKVRDIYAASEESLLIVVTDRLSAFDVVLPTPVPFKGKILNQISSFWFRFFEPAVEHHLITDRVAEAALPRELMRQWSSMLEGRSMLVRRTKPLPVECVVRGYLAGSGWKDYLATGSVCGHKLPAGLKQCGKLPEPLFTPATKDMVGHDENISFDEVVRLVGKEIAVRVRDLSLEIYNRGAEWAESKGIIVADTKFEFGLSPEGRLVLIDEVLTPDSSRFWPRAGYEPGKDQPSFDKQIVRNYLESLGWDKKPPGPVLPRDVIEKTSQAYRDVYRRLTGRELG
jgi:phosphoribosylaminoimidazole-succinocarboxamide synthase